MTVSIEYSRTVETLQSCTSLQGLPTKTHTQNIFALDKRRCTAIVCAWPHRGNLGRYIKRADSPERKFKVVNLKELTPVTETLNAKSDKVNQIIADLNAKLAKLNIGLEASTSNIQEGGWQIEYSDDDGDPLRRTRDVFELGYAKVNEQWVLAIAQYEETQQYAAWSVSGRPSYEEIERSGATWTPLLQASRSLRIAALSQVEELITEIHRLAQSEIETIDKARELADRL